MSLGIKLVQAVQKETAMKRPLPLQATVQDARGNQRVEARLCLADNDRFSHMAEEITVQLTRAPAKSPAVATPAIATGAQPRVRKVADRFAAQATYLCEALQFVECDAAGSAVVRSSPSSMRGRRAPYFEAHVDEGSISLKRYEPSQQGPGRSAVPFCVTDEVLSRLVDDAVEVLLPAT